MHIGIIGCGQLARMIALDGLRMGLSFSFLAEPNESLSCVTGLGTIIERKAEHSAQDLFEALGKPEVITVEREHVDVALLESLQVHSAVYPKPNAVEITQHRGKEKGFLSTQGIPTVDYRLADSEQGIRSAFEQLGFPAIVKTCEEGYDGNGQWRIKSDSELELFVSQDLSAGTEYVVEAFCPFERELSVLVVRSASGETVCYPQAENRHHEGILLTSIAPIVNDAASKMALKIVGAMDYVGVLAIELFEVKGELVVNELAPRVHNSGHWTQAAGVSSQFENHLRAITDLNLGNTKPFTNVAMINLLGKMADIKLAHQSNTQLHDYNKSERPKRKLGHLNLWNSDREALQTQMAELLAQLYPEID